MMEADLKTKLSAVAASVSGRVHPNYMPQDGSLPAAVYQRISTQRSLTAGGGTLDMVQTRMQVDCFAETFGAALATATEVRVGMNGFSGMMGSTTVHMAKVENEYSDYESTPGAVSRVTLDLIIFYDE